MIHQYKNNGFNIVIDVHTGSIYSVDELSYDVIDLINDGREKTEIIQEINCKYNKDLSNDITEIIEDINELKNQGLLFSEDVFKEFATQMKDKQSILKAICLHVAHSCNMDCMYCFAGKGEYHDGSGLMSFETAKRAIDFLIANSDGRTNLEVDFFGGEPLLNIDVCKKVVAYARSIEKDKDKNFRFTMTTNGILLDESIYDFLNEEMSNVVLSLDGKKETNDRMRKTKSGKGTYDLVIDKFINYLKTRGDKEYYIRGTYTGFNKDFFEDIIDIANRGFKELAMEPVVTSPDNDYALTMEDIEQLKDNYDKLSLEMIRRYEEGNLFNFYHYSVDFEGGPCISKRISGCGVGTEYVAITPEGEIYPCHQFVGDKDYLIGNIKEIDFIDKKRIEPFRYCNVYTREECRDCFAKLYCSGGCSANAYHQNGNINSVCEFSCELHKKRIENAIMMKLAMDEIDEK
ncbi:MAG: thioether cross-link-forming SCIFF peptide maturase [Eubacteriales bacterium]|nr:thioether cross-link-forming SCIFF peptide maturase [Eubacteriales bacterium]MDY3332934.1 thioether cross-link-forming SCIFF peptide maturase [Gallibacter sp.]